MDAQTPVSQSHVPVAVATPAPQPVAPPAPPRPVPPLSSWAPIYENDPATLQRSLMMDSHEIVVRYGHRSTSPMLWERLTQKQRDAVAKSQHLRHNQATDLPPDS